MSWLSQLTAVYNFCLLCKFFLQKTMPFLAVYLRVSKDRSSPAISAPPYVFMVWFGLGFQIFLEITCPGMIFHFQKDLWSLDDQNPPRQLWTFFIFHWLEITPTQFVRVPPGISFEPYFFSQNETIYGAKSVLPFCKLIIGKSQVFSTSLYNVHVFAQMYANACQGAYMPPSPLGQTGLIVSTNCLKYAYLVFKIVCPKIWSHKMFGQFYGRNSDSEQRLCCYFLKKT